MTRSAIIAACLSLSLLLPSRLSHACWVPVWGEASGYSLLQARRLPEDPRSAAAFMINLEQFYGADLHIDENIEEWRAVFCDDSEEEDVRQLIYEAPLEALESLRNAIRKPTNPLAPVLRDNSFALQLRRERCAPTVDYLIYAKQCEPHVRRVVDGGQWKTTRRDAPTMLALAERGRQAFMNEASHYLRLRYAYQIVRLAHYAGEHQKALDYYDALRPKADQRESVMNYWLLALRAGALTKLGRRVEGAYLFAQVFQNSRNLRPSAYYSFSLKSDEEWAECLRLCQSDAERAALYTLRALAPNSQVVPEMRAIHALFPASGDLRALLFREMKVLEKYFLGFRGEAQLNRQYTPRQRDAAARRLAELRELCYAFAQDREVPYPELWQMSAGYLAFLAGDLSEAQQVLARAAERVRSGSPLGLQLQAMQVALEVQALTSVDDAKERWLFELLSNNPITEEFPDLTRFALQRFARLYEGQKQWGKAYRCRFPLSYLFENPQPDVVGQLAALAEKDPLNPLEMYFLSEDKKMQRQRILELKATVHLAQHELDSAYRTLLRIPYANLEKRYNPFQTTLGDCVHCPLPDTITLFNKLDIVERLIELEYQAKADLEKGPRYFYLLGVAYYNMSYFGYSWSLMDYYRSGRSWEFMKEGAVVPSTRSPLGNREHFDLKLAKTFFERARQLSTDPEVAARAAFWLARCDRNAYYASPDNRYKPGNKNIPQLFPHHSNYYTALHTQYRDTRYYEDLVKECLYFRAYARR